jgi:hypothetical protein
MAKKRKAPTRAKASEAAKPSDVKKMPSANKIKELARSYENAKEKTSEIGGTIGSALRTASENNNLHTGAFRQAMKEKRMEAGRLADYYDHLDFYRDVLGLLDKAKSAPRLEFGPGEEDDEEETQQPANVSAFPKPAVAAE